MITQASISKDQANMLVWLRKGAGNKVFDNPSLRRLPFGYGFVDAARQLAAKGGFKSVSEYILHLLQVEAKYASIDFPQREPRQWGGSRKGAGRPSKTDEV